MTAVEAARHLSTDHSTQWSDKKILCDFTNDVTMSILCLLKSLTSEATHSATQFFKRSYKISHPPLLKASQDALPPRCEVPKLDFQSEFSMSKIIRIFLNPPVKRFTTKWRNGSVKKILQSYDNNWAAIF